MISYFVVLDSLNYTSYFPVLQSVTFEDSDGMA